MTQPSLLTTGYHGTTIDRAKAIVDSGHFFQSSNDWDWLGLGVYFWEHAPLHAWKWATQLAESEDAAAVVSIQIDTSTCFDLLDRSHWRAVREQFELIRLQYDMIHERLPKQRALVEALVDPNNRSNGKNELDRLVVDELMKTLASSGEEFHSVRAAFSFKNRVYTKSFFGWEDHVQIAVRNQAAFTGPPILEDSKILKELYMDSA